MFWSQCAYKKGNVNDFTGCWGIGTTKKGPNGEVSGFLADDPGERKGKSEAPGGGLVGFLYWRSQEEGGSPREGGHSAAKWRIWGGVNIFFSGPKIFSSKTTGPGEQGAAGCCPKTLLLKRAKMVLCPFHRSHREICTRNRPVSQTIFWGPLPLPAPLFCCWKIQNAPKRPRKYLSFVQLS